jgi:hypothetical protein
MGRVVYVQNVLNGGVFSPSMFLRDDLNTFKNSCQTMENFVPLPYGGARTRHGLRFIAESYRNRQPILATFEIDSTRAYALEIGQSYIRFYTPTGPINNLSGSLTNVTAGAGYYEITSTAHGLTTNDYIVVSGVNLTNEPINQQWKVTVIDPNTFRLVENGAGQVPAPGSSGAVTGTWARPYVITAPYQANELETLRWVQTPDSLFLIHPKYPPKALTRITDTNWTLADIDFVDGPYFDENRLTATGAKVSITLTPSAATGAITLNASLSMFTTNDVGRQIRIKEGATWGYVEITAYTSSTQVNATVFTTLTNVNPKAVWRLGSWSVATGYPTSATIFQQRMVFAASAAEPQTMWMSTSNSYIDMSPSATTGTIAASDALTFTIGSGRVNNIQWLVGGQQLFIGTLGEEFTLAGSGGSAVSANNPPLVKQTSSEGSNLVPAVRIANQTMFIQRSGREVRAVQVGVDSSEFVTTNVSLPADHYMETASITWLTTQARPVRAAHMVLADGSWLSFVYYPAEAVSAWARMTTVGKVKHMATLVDSTFTSEQAWYVVERQVKGIARYYVEREDASVNTDSATVVDVSPAKTTFTNTLEHIGGLTAAVIGDKAVFDPQVVSDGRATLVFGASSGLEASVIEAGLPIPTPTVIPTEPISEDPTGKYRGRRRQWATLYVSLLNALGLTVGSTELPYRTPADLMDTAVPAFTGEKQVTVLGACKNLTFEIKQTQPLSAHVRGYYGTLNVED